MRQKQSKKGQGEIRGRGDAETNRRGERSLRVMIVFASGILMGLTVAPVNAWFLAWFALAPLWVLVVSSAQRKNQSPPLSPSPHARCYNGGNLRNALAPLPLLSLAWGIAYHGMALSWITGIHPMTWMGVPWLASLGIALFCWIFITLWGAVLVTLWATCFSWIVSQEGRRQNAERSLIGGNLRSKLRRDRRNILNFPLMRVLIGTALWCGLEALWSAGPLWWSSISYTQSPHNLVILHLGQLAGPSAVTAAIVAVNGLIAEAWINRKDAKNSLCSSCPLWFVYLGSATTLLITLHLIGFSLYTRPLIQPPQAALQVGIIQGNIPNQIKLYPEGLRRAIAGYTSGYLTLADKGVDAVLTPEGALPFFQREIMRGSLVAAVQEKGIVAWIGGFGERGSSYTNSLFTVTGDGKIFSRYDKSKLVPIGEYVPFEEFLGSIISRLSPLDEHQVPGSPNQVFDTPFGRAIVGICYESAFSDLFRRQAAAGGQFILSPSNDAHYSASMPAQHHAQDIMRAIETDRWAVRATNTGYSAFVDPHGRTLWISGHNTYEIHAETIYRRQTQTLYVRWGDWLTPLLLVLAGGIWLVNLLI
ncbi:apolipoprotein N-acyltransferase [Chlorogloeopsis sp. ULAP01]|uniref:apolipoprotein N-acyltransferase n=1 Tax=Chlorogloeopsis sp. ULAP01 TaxID=3056483 RepID=UPI0025AA6B2C|nr:apolipoprotein N-acyltransferase [Chlorogloeopsis sp. ULAP01]MDM9381753.1 apolipoprotein N-acyltransferase [Chlorogloeopsis sp. ULAP01]